MPAPSCEGRYAVCIPDKTAWELHQRWTESAFHILPNAAQADKELGILDRPTRAADLYGKGGYPPGHEIRAVQYP